MVRQIQHHQYSARALVTVAKRMNDFKLVVHDSAGNELVNSLVGGVDEVFPVAQ